MQTDTTATPASPERRRRTSRAMPLKLHLQCRSSLAATAAPHHHHALDAARATSPPPRTTTMQPTPGTSPRRRCHRGCCSHVHVTGVDKHIFPPLATVAVGTRHRGATTSRVRVGDRRATMAPCQGRCHATMVPHRPPGGARRCAAQPRRRRHTSNRPSASARRRLQPVVAAIAPGLLPPAVTDPDRRGLDPAMETPDLRPYSAADAMVDGPLRAPPPPRRRS